MLSLLANGSNINLEVGETSEDAVSRCGAVQFDLTLLDACGGPVDPYFDSRYEWVVRLQGEGRTSYTSADCQPVHGNHWDWDGCGGDADDITRATFGSVNPGTYEARAYRVDLPERNNLDYERELDWRDHEAFELGEVEIDGDAAFEATVADPWADDC
ncbi:MAG: hypothetical protein GWO04_28460 [Actinobacteria bacterium]|nr:hypothetical protein [Actinomycetota bacterium]